MKHPALAVCSLLLAAASASAQYKIVRPDGSVTYTDRPPADATARITPLNRTAAQGPSSPEAALPAELRQAMQRYPVTLYTSADCAPCDSGRKLLLARGVPFSERRVTSDEDAAALERLAGGRTVPSLTVGAQQLRGLSDSDWTAYLDAAGYPRESKLPRGWQPPAPQPLVEKAQPGKPQPVSPPNQPPNDPRPDDPPSNPAGVRF